MKGLAGFAIVALTLSSCSETKYPNHFSDSHLVLITGFQDRRATDSLLIELKDANPVYRSAASIALASVQDTTASNSLGALLLEDPDSIVRADAAFALGQTGGIAAVNALIPAIHDHNSAVVREVLEALGKSVSKNDLSQLLDFRPLDSLQEAGLATAYYRLGLRDLADSVVTIRMGEFLTKGHANDTRIAAAHFFGRSRVKGSGYENNLVNAVLHDPLPEVRMAAVGGVKRIEPQKALGILKQVLTLEPDYRVRNGALRACANIKSKESTQVLLTGLKDKSRAVQITSSELLPNATADLSPERIRMEIASNTNTRVKANLFGELLNMDSGEKTVNEIIKEYEGSDNYGKAQLLEALSFAHGSGEMTAFRFIALNMVKSSVRVIKSNAAGSLVAMNYHKEFFRKNQAAFAEAHRSGIDDGDAAVIGTLASALADSVLDFKSILHDYTFLHKAQEKLQLPRDIESLQPLLAAIAVLEGKGKPQPLKNSYNHPIDWKLVKSIPSDQRAMIKTSRGDVVIRLFVEETPGSVANFVDLAGRKYFDGKFFHRVVPNFVIQTGCYRGDGFGSEAYSIRSEFSRRRYATGSVGMASAGKDTEGTQWFITHSPTPHLDGRYTLFASVVAGQEIVDQIEVGDSILHVSLMK